MKKILLSILLIAITLACGCGCGLGSECSCQSPNLRGGLSRAFTLSLQYAARKSVAFNSNQGKIFWNNQHIATLSPNNYHIHTFRRTVYASIGSNVLRIEGSGVSNSYGLTIDNVELVRQGTCQNIVVNGDFETPAQNYQWHIYPGVLGWASNEI